MNPNNKYTSKSKSQGESGKNSSINMEEIVQNPYYGGDDPTTSQTNVTTVENPYYGGDDPTDNVNNVVVIENPYYGGDDPRDTPKLKEGLR